MFGTTSSSGRPSPGRGRALTPMLADKYKSYMHDMIRKVVDEIGPRPPCGPQERMLGDMLVKEWKPVCDKVEKHKFRCSPYAFLGFMPFAVLLYMGGVAAYWFYPQLALALSALGTALLLFEFVRYKEFVDFLFPKADGESIIGTIKPKGKVKRRVIVCGHMDSAYEFNIWLVLKNAAIPVMIVGIVGVLTLFFGSIAKTVAVYAGDPSAQVYNIVGYVALGLAPVVALFFVFHTYKPVPGAMDDMAGVAVASALGKMLKDEKSAGDPLKNTEVVLIGMSSEEAGLRGSKRYVADNKAKLKEIPTYGIFLDGIYDEKFLAVMTREVCTGAKHDPALVKLAQEAAASRGLPIKTTLIPLGASDATPFSLAGISSTTIVCQDVSRLVPNYHTRYDTIEHVRPESLSVSLQLTMDMVRKIDAGALDSR